MVLFLFSWGKNQDCFKFCHFCQKLIFLKKSFILEKSNFQSFNVKKSNITPKIHNFKFFQYYFYKSIIFPYQTLKNTQIPFPEEPSQNVAFSCLRLHNNQNLRPFPRLCHTKIAISLFR